MNKTSLELYLFKVLQKINPNVFYTVHNFYPHDSNDPKVQKRYLKLYKIINKLNELGLESLEAYYVCVLVGIKSLDDPMPLITQGEIHGYVSVDSSGTGGFGYDKIFYPNDFDCSMASLEPDIKNSISHRAIATTKFLEIFNND